MSLGYYESAFPSRAGAGILISPQFVLFSGDYVPPAGMECQPDPEDPTRLVTATGEIDFVSHSGNVIPDYVIQDTIVNTDHPGGNVVLGNGAGVGNDIMILGKLQTPILPSDGVTPASILPADWAQYIPSDGAGIPVLRIDEWRASHDRGSRVPRGAQRSHSTWPDWNTDSTTDDLKDWSSLAPFGPRLR